MITKDAVPTACSQKKNGKFEFDTILLKIKTNDGDTALHRAVRIRNPDFVELLLEKKAKINAINKKGDTALHLAMRARSKKVVEVLLRLPKNNQLLYKPNDQVGVF